MLPPAGPTLPPGRFVSALPSDQSINVLGHRWPLPCDNPAGSASVPAGFLIAQAAFRCIGSRLAASGPQDGSGSPSVFQRVWRRLQRPAGKRGGWCEVETIPLVLPHAAGVTSPFSLWFGFGGAGGSSSGMSRQWQVSRPPSTTLTKTPPCGSGRTSSACGMGATGRLPGSTHPTGPPPRPERRYGTGEGLARPSRQPLSNAAEQGGGTRSPMVPLLHRDGHLRQPHV